MDQRRAKYEAAADRAARIFYSMNDYNRRIDAIETALDDVCRGEGGQPCAGPVREAVLRDLFYRTIANRPIEYVELVADGLIEAWRGRIMDAWSGFYHDYRLEADTRATRLEQIRLNSLPLTPEDITLDRQLTDKWQGAVVAKLDTLRSFFAVQRWFLYVAGAASFLAMFVALFVRSRHWLALGYCGVLIHGAMVLTAAVTVFIPRYALPIDLIVLVAGVVFADWLLATIAPLIGRLWLELRHRRRPTGL